MSQPLGPEDDEFFGGLPDRQPNEEGRALAHLGLEGQLPFVLINDH